MLVHEGGYGVEKEGEAFRFFDRWGGVIPEVPDAPEGFERIGHEITHVNAETNAPLWDGSSLDYGAAVSGLMDDRRVAWVDPDGEEDPSTRADPRE